MTNALSIATEEAWDVVSCSFSLPSYDRDLAVAATTYVRAGGVLVAAAGNRRRVNNAFPRECRAAIVVGGVDRRDRPLGGAARGPYIDVSGPARDLVALTPAGRLTRRFGGTSGATAIVAGACALALSWARASGGTDDVAKALPGLLAATARDVGRRGVDDATGAGIVNVPALLDRVDRLVC